MSKNLIPKIAELLGVELGEEFECYSAYDCITHKLKFKNDGLYHIQELFSKDAEGNEQIFTRWIMCSTADKLLANILSGEIEIIKLPWKPKFDEKYWSFMVRRDYTDKTTWSVAVSIWLDHPADWALLDKGWVYRTRAEAEAALPAVAKALGVEYDL